MEKSETQSEEVHIINGELATIFRVLSNPDALKILYRAGQGIENSTHTIEELDLTPKKYYYRLKELMTADLVKKVNGVYRQTSMGRIIYDRFLPAMGKTYDAREELELIVYLEGTELENGVRRLIEEKLEIPSFAESADVKIIDSHESMVVDVIDLCDEAEESVLMASNHCDVRVMEATFRSVDRGVTNKIIAGEKGFSSRIQQLRMVLSPSFARSLINFASNEVDLENFIRIIDLPYSFCVVDGYLNVLEFSNPIKEEFIVAVAINDRKLGEKLTQLFEVFWELGKHSDAFKFLRKLKSTP